MLIVSLTRAKKRFYVIGNQNRWGTAGFYRPGGKIEWS
jgi:superfamily I DNA and/or RNA helicase